LTRTLSVRAAYTARMIQITLDDQTLSRTRMALSPLWELVCGLHLVWRYRADDAPWPYTRWVARARAILRDLPGTAPALIYCSGSSELPDFLLPIPPTPAPAIADELDALRRTPPEAVIAQLSTTFDLDDLPPWIQPFHADPSGALDELAQGLAAYWDAALAPQWPAIRAALDEEVMHRARTLAAHGPDLLLTGLHERVRWERPLLTLVKGSSDQLEGFDKRLLLIPLVFSPGALLCTTEHPEVVAVGYQARGAAVLADERPAPLPDDRLAILIGRGRASVLRALSTPATTAGVAAALGLAPSTVSEHLGSLSTAGVVVRRRNGRRVLYQLEPAGVALVSLLGIDEVRERRPAKHSAATESVSRLGRRD
jgi:DNA-binding transcriptional ArsR family regulator